MMTDFTFSGLTEPSLDKSVPKFVIRSQIVLVACDSNLRAVVAVARRRDVASFIFCFVCFY